MAGVDGTLARGLSGGPLNPMAKLLRSADEGLVREEGVVAPCRRGVRRIIKQGVLTDGRTVNGDRGDSRRPVTWRRATPFPRSVLNPVKVLMGERGPENSDSIDHRTLDVKSYPTITTPPQRWTALERSGKLSPVWSNVGWYGAIMFPIFFGYVLIRVGPGYPFFVFR